MLELQGDLGSLLRQLAGFESIRELIGLANSQKELGLGQRAMHGHAILFGGSR